MIESPQEQKKSTGPFRCALGSAFCFAGNVLILAIGAGFPGALVEFAAIFAGLGVGCAVSAIHLDLRRRLHTRSFRWAVILLIGHLIVILYLVGLVLANSAMRREIIPYWRRILGL